MKPFYDDNQIKLYNGDALDVLPMFTKESIDAIISDPPFTFTGGISQGRSSRPDTQFFEHWLVSIFKQLYRISKPEAAWFLWCDWRTLATYESALAKAAPDYHEQRWISQVLIHDREMIGMGKPFRNQTDWIALIRGKKTDFKERIPKNQPNVIRDYWYYGKHPNHPAEKSVKTAQKLIEWSTDENQTILDFCAGSATILEAARQIKRRAIGIEIEEAYCQVALRRFTQSPLLLEAV